MRLSKKDDVWIDDTIHKANNSAMEKWGSGWTNLTFEMRRAFICAEIVERIGAIDFEDVFESRVKDATSRVVVTDPKLVETLFSRLIRIQIVCEVVSIAGEDAPKLKRVRSTEV